MELVELVELANKVELVQLADRVELAEVELAGLVELVKRALS